MNIKKLILLTITLPILSISCSTPTKYKPSKKGEYGYKSYSLNKDYYKVVFKGNEDTPKKKVANYLLYRIAELTQKNGYKNFTIVERDVNVDTEVTKTKVYSRNMYRPQVLGYVDGFNSYPYYTNANRYAPARTKIKTEKEYEITAFVKMTNRENPLKKGSFYNTENVISVLKPTIDRP